MTREENIKAILECNFVGFKEEIINTATKRICELEQEPKWIPVAERLPKEENLHWLNQEIRTWENECQSKHPIKEALYAARKALEQEIVIDKIRERVEKLQKACGNDDLNLLAQRSAFGMVLDIIDEYRTESEVKANENEK